MAKMANLFERLAQGRPPQIEEIIKPQIRTRKAELKSRLKTLLTDVLANGPAPTTLVHQRAAAHGFSRKQLWSTRERMKIVAFKEEGKPHGRWFLALPQHVSLPSTTDEQPQKTP